MTRSERTSVLLSGTAEAFPQEYNQPRRAGRGLRPRLCTAEADCIVAEMYSDVSDNETEARRACHRIVLSNRPFSFHVRIAHQIPLLFGAFLMTTK